MLSEPNMTNIISMKQVSASGFARGSSLVQCFFMPAPSLSLATTEKIGYSYERTARNAFH